VRYRRVDNDSRNVPYCFEDSGKDKQLLGVVATNRGRHSRSHPRSPRHINHRDTTQLLLRTTIYAETGVGVLCQYVYLDPIMKFTGQGQEIQVHIEMASVLERR